jgi:putative ABC transport system permease protein
MPKFPLNATACSSRPASGADALRANPLRTVLSTTGVIIGVAALVAAFAVTDGVAVWSRELIMRESSVQDVAVSPLTSSTVNGRTVRCAGTPCSRSTTGTRRGARSPASRARR